MSNYSIHIKNMVCPRCVKAIEATLTRFGISYSEVKLGEVLLNENLSLDKRSELSESLENQGFELLDDKKSQLIEKIKNSIIEIVHHQDDPHKIGHLSTQLPKLLGHSYTYLSSFFSEMEGITIEKYLILQKIEKVKELLSYSELSISEVSYQLNYSSSQHLSRQFKSITGMTPSEFLKKKSNERKPINDIK